jgi:glycosyltransferase involved in cell wall biosynthesis
VSTVLVVAPLYRPSEAPGALRAGAFVDELERRGWTCRVLTIATDAPAAPSAVPLRHRPDGPLTRALAHARLSRLATTLRVPDAHAPWALRAIRAGLAIGRSENVVAVLSTSLPASAAVVGATLARRLDAPHIADFRDPWSFNPYYVWPSLPHHWIDSRLESWVLRHSAAVLCVSNDMADAIAQRYPDAASRIRVVLNGVAASSVAVTDANAESGNAFVLTTSPGPYTPRRHRWPYFFHGSESDHTAGLETIVGALQSLDGIPEVTLRVIAAPAADVAPLAGSRVTTEIYDQLPRTAFLTITEDADLLYLPVVENPHIHPRGIAIPTRLYEYLATGRELIVAASEGAAKDLATSQPGVTVIPPGNVDALGRAIRTSIEHWSARGRSFYAGRAVPTREEAAVRVADLVGTLVAR